MSTSNLQSPLNAYQLKLKNQQVSHDQHQQHALQTLDQLFHQLLNPTQKKPIMGVYLWGDVGRGKTFLMDLFFQSLPEGISTRLHFHHFMARLHRELNLAFGQKNPLEGIAKRLAKEYKVICFDEFFISDIGDAMLLSGLMESLFSEGVTLVATSNIAIKNLFHKQLQEENFLATIALFQQNLTEIHLSGNEDHRLRHQGFSPIYFVAEKQKMKSLFTEIVQGDITNQPITICGRTLTPQATASNIIWFDFYAICDGPRSSLDYIELAQRYPYIMITGIPELSSEPYEQIKARGTEDGAIGSGQTGERKVSLGINDDAVRRFISLVDECYDHQVILLLNADVELEQLYKNGTLLFEFRRTYSRLLEMKSYYYQQLRPK
jgi:cell division protein ZapE